MHHPSQQLSPMPLPHPPPEGGASVVPYDSENEDPQIWSGPTSWSAHSTPFAQAEIVEGNDQQLVPMQSVAASATTPSYAGIQAGSGETGDGQVGNPSAATVSPFPGTIIAGGATAGAVFGISGAAPPMGQTVDVTTVVADGNEITQGVPIEDNGLNKVVRRVILLAAAGATFYVVIFICNLLRGAYNYDSSSNHTNATSLWTALSSLLIELSIPACGYCGALYSNRQLTCCYCSCNLFITIVSIMSFIRLNIRIGEIEGQCEQERNMQQRRTCEVWMSNGAEKYMMLTSTIVIICIGCAAFWFGNSLYNRLSQDFTLTMPPPAPIVGEVVALNGFVSTSTGAPIAGTIAGATAIATVAASSSSTATPGIGNETRGNEATPSDANMSAAMPAPAERLRSMEDGQPGEDRVYEAAPPLLPSTQPVVELLHGIQARGRVDHGTATAATLQQE